MSEQFRDGKTGILQNRGLWMMPNVYPGRLRREGSAPLVVSARGTRCEWALSHPRWRKRLMWRLGQAGTFERADAFYTTADSEPGYRR